MEQLDSHRNGFPRNLIFQGQFTPSFPSVRMEQLDFHSNGFPRNLIFQGQLTPSFPSVRPHGTIRLPQERISTKFDISGTTDPVISIRPHGTTRLPQQRISMKFDISGTTDPVISIRPHGTTRLPQQRIFMKFDISGTIDPVISVRPSVRMEQLDSHRNGFPRNLIIQYFWKMCPEHSISLKSDKNNRYCTLRHVYIYDRILLDSS